VPHPTWLAYSFAAVMVAVSLYCIAWLIVATRRSLQNHVDVNISHVAMGLAMAGMLVHRLNLLPDGLWEAVFVAIALWFSWQGVRFVMRTGTAPFSGASHGLSHYLIHLVMALAMMYMYLAAVPASATAGAGLSMTGPTGTTADFVGLPLLFVMILFASAVWQLDGLSRYAPSHRTLVGAGILGDRGPDGARGSWEIPGAPRGEAPRQLQSGAGASPFLAPRLEMGCHIAMCITMGYMLVLML
jgi:hypothetical protein